MRGESSLSAARSASPAAVSDDAGDENHDPLEANYRQLHLWGDATTTPVQIQGHLTHPDGTQARLNEQLQFSQDALGVVEDGLHGTLVGVQLCLLQH